MKRISGMSALKRGNLIVVAIDEVEWELSMRSKIEPPCRPWVGLGMGSAGVFSPGVVEDLHERE